MKNMLRRLTTVLAGFTLAATMLLGAVSTAHAGDKIYLKDGRVLQGEITRELEGSVWLNYTIGGVEQKGFFASGEIDHIEHDDGKTAPPSTPQAPKADTAKVQPKRAGVPRGVVITLEGEVGIQFASKPLEDMIPWLEQQQVDIVVLKVNSGGGLLLEIPKMHKALYEEFKPRFRTVAWIESAISAAAMSSHVLEEIYFMKDGNYGACTGWHGALQLADEFTTEKALAMMEDASAKGNHPKEIMHSMQLGFPLSCNRDSNGEFHWFNSDEGEYLVNPKDRILTFDSQQATQYKFSKGTADNLDELTRLLGYPEVDWLGEHVPGEIFPICKGEQDMRKWRDDITRAEDDFQTNYVKYEMAVQNARGSQDIKQRGTFVGLARRHLAVIERAAKTYPNFMLLRGLTIEWFEQQHQLLKDLMKP
ncbi:MAG: hypothetical protein IPJ41_03255 [Phycisphaerales bacterium]|nr:hypothetical protein [Phycisphaerales bacterium]